MATETHSLKVSKSKDSEIERIKDVLTEISWLGEELRSTNLSDIDFSEYEILSKFDKQDTEEFLGMLCRTVKGLMYEKAIVNLQVLLENCADPNLGHLDFNKDIKKGLELLEASELSQVKAD